MSAKAARLLTATLCALLVATGAWPGNLAAADERRDGSPTTAPASLVYPNGLALDRDGNLLISDIGTHQIFRLERDGKLTVVAGTGEPGFSGDDGPATAAKLASPSDLAFDGDGNLLIADTFNNRIRRIDPRGVITTLAAEGLSLNNPQGIAVDRDGILYVADTYNHVVRCVDPRAGVASVLAGTEAGLAGDKGPANQAQLNLPQAVAVGPDGAVYISDSANSRVRRVGRDGVIHTVAGHGEGANLGGAGFAGDGGPAEKAKLFSPADLKFNGLGQLYISDAGNNRVRLVAHGVVITIAGTGTAEFSGDGGPAVSAGLNTPQKLAIGADGSIYFADRVNRRVRKVDPRGVVSTVAGGSAPAGEALLDPGVLRGPTTREKP